MRPLRATNSDFDRHRLGSSPSPQRPKSSECGGAVHAEALEQEERAESGEAPGTSSSKPRGRWPWKLEAILDPVCVEAVDRAEPGEREPLLGARDERVLPGSLLPNICETSNSAWLSVSSASEGASGNGANFGKGRGVERSVTDCCLTEPVTTSSGQRAGSEA